MGLIGMILAAVLVAVLLAIVIVKYLPLKLRWIASILLMVLSVLLVYKIYYGIMQPIIFNKHKVTKYAKVIKQLKIIRDAEVKHFEVVGNYTKDKAGLIKFIDTAQVALTETKTIVEKEDRGGGIIIDVEIRKTDTIGYESVAKYFKGRNYNDMFKVPGSKGKEFEIEVGTVEKVQGLVVPTFLVKTDKVGILKGMDASLIKQELEAVATDQIKGEYVSVGSLDEVSTGGNWPPSYDKQKGSDKKNSNITLINIKDTKLSIQFNLDGFSFCISNNTTKEVLYFSEYLFEEKQITPESLLKKIEEIFKTDEQLQKDFSSVLIIHQNNLFTLVPNSYFSEDKLSEYLNFNIKTLATDFIAFDDIQSINAKNVYVPYVNINNYLFQNFGGFEYKHHLTAFIENLISLSNSDEKKVFVNVSKDTIDVVVIQNKQLEFSNSFYFETKEDFIYYILFTFEQLKLDVEEVKLYFTGDIELESEIYNITFQYIRNIFFLESKSTIFNKLNASKHSNYILLNS